MLGKGNSHPYPMHNFRTCPTAWPEGGAAVVLIPIYFKILPAEVITWCQRGNMFMQASEL